MGIPGNGTVCWIWTKAYPLVTRSAEDTICFKFSNIWVRSQILNSLFFGALSAATFGKRKWQSCYIGSRACWLARRSSRCNTKIRPPISEARYITHNKRSLPSYAVGVPMLDREATCTLIAKWYSLPTYLANNAASLIFSPLGCGITCWGWRRLRSIIWLLSFQRISGPRYQRLVNKSTSNIIHTMWVAWFALHCENL